MTIVLRIKYANPFEYYIPCLKSENPSWSSTIYTLILSVYPTIINYILKNRTSLYIGFLECNEILHIHMLISL